MSVNTERDLLIKELEQVEDPALLKAVKALLDYGLKNGGRISLEQYNLELNEAQVRIDIGEFISQEDLEKKFDIEAMEASIGRGLKESMRGEVEPHEQVMKAIRARF